MPWEKEVLKGDKFVYLPLFAQVSINDWWQWKAQHLKIVVFGH